jgi:hypothetical protein
MLRYAFGVPRLVGVCFLVMLEADVFIWLDVCTLFGRVFHSSRLQQYFPYAQSSFHPFSLNDALATSLRFMRGSVAVISRDAV